MTKESPPSKLFLLHEYIVPRLTYCHAFVDSHLEILVVENYSLQVLLSLEDPSPIHSIALGNVNDAMILSSLNEKDKMKEIGSGNNFPLENVANSPVKNILLSEFNKCLLHVLSQFI